MFLLYYKWEAMTINQPFLKLILCPAVKEGASCSSGIGAWGNMLKWLERRMSRRQKLIVYHVEFSFKLILIIIITLELILIMIWVPSDINIISRASRILCVPFFFPANYMLSFGEYLQKIPNYAKCTIVLCKNFLCCNFNIISLQIFFEYKIIHFQTTNMWKKVVLPSNKSKNGIFFFSKLWLVMFLPIMAHVTWKAKARVLRASNIGMPCWFVTEPFLQWSEFGYVPYLWKKNFMHLLRYENPAF